MNEKLLTPKEYILLQVAEYPILFIGYSYEEAAFKVLDHLLNIIGSEEKNHEDFTQELTGVPTNETLAYKYLKNEPFYNGYTNVTECSGMVMLSGINEKPLVALKSEKINYPQIKLWIESDPTPKHKLFSNVTENNLNIYKKNLQKFGNEWEETATWFIEKVNNLLINKPLQKNKKI